MPQAIDISALLAKHGGVVPPHHVEADVPDGTYAGLVRFAGKRAIVEGPQLTKLLAAIPGKVRVLYAVGDEPKAQQDAPPEPPPTPPVALEAPRGRRPHRVVADAKPAPPPPPAESWDDF